MSTVACPSCGTSIEVAEKKGMSGWLIGCLVAVVVLPVIIGVIGLLAAIAIPSFVKARDTSQQHACMSNMQQIDAAKQMWSSENEVTFAQPVELPALVPFLGAMPVCPNGGEYEIGSVGEEPACSLHGSLSDPHGSYPGR